MAPYGTHLKVGLGFGVMDALGTTENQSRWKVKVC
jgi:hypothetical protein